MRRPKRGLVTRLLVLWGASLVVALFIGFVAAPTALATHYEETDAHIYYQPASGTTITQGIVLGDVFRSLRGTVTVFFNGAGIWVGGVKGPDYGTADVLVNGVDQGDWSWTATGASLATIGGFNNVGGPTFRNWFQIKSNTSKRINVASIEIGYGTLVDPPVPTITEAFGGNGYCEVYWDPVIPAPTYYKIYRDGAYHGVVWPPLTKESDSTNVVNGTTYSYQVAAVYGDYEAPKSVTASCTPHVPVPTGLSAIPGDGMVQLTWNAAAGANNLNGGYNVYRDGVKVNSAPVTSTNYLDTGLTSGVTYSYQVTAIVNGQESAKSSAVTATLTAVPTGLFAKTGTDAEVWLGWDAVSGASGYNLYRGGTKLNSSPITSTNYLDTGLTNGVTYSSR